MFLVLILILLLPSNILNINWPDFWNSTNWWVWEIVVGCWVVLESNY